MGCCDLLKEPLPEMTTERTQSSNEQETRSTEAPTVSPSKGLSRRALLRGASVALPTILTLDSASALAAATSAHLMGTVSTASRAVGPNGKIQCVGGDSAVGGTWQKLDLGPTPMIRAQYITPRSYYKSNGAGTAGDLTRPVTIENMCSQGGVYWYRQTSGWTTQWVAAKDPTTNSGVKAGFLVSATALTSFASSIKIKSYF